LRPPAGAAPIQRRLRPQDSSLRQPLANAGGWHPFHFPWSGAKLNLSHWDVPRTRKLCVAVFFLVGGTCPAFAAEPLAAQVVSAMRQATIPPDAASFYAQDVTSPTPLIAVNADRSMNPASTMKLVTTYAALQLLGPAFTWKTQILSNAPLAGDVLLGDIAIRGSGDPKLVVEDFWLMLRQLRDRGVREINGDVLLDHSIFASAQYDPAEFDGEGQRPYNVGPDGLLVNYKAITLEFFPDDAQHIVHVGAMPALTGQTVGGAKYLDGACGDWKARLGLDISDPDQVRFAGGFPGSCGDKTWSVSVYSHSRYVAALFRSIWTELGGTLHGQIRDGLTPAGGRVLAEQTSEPLADIVRATNKYSNNVMAKELFLDIAHEILGTQASADQAQRAVHSFLASRGIDATDLVLENGSGLSRTERISALELGRILRDAWNSPVMPEFVASLPLVGFDGTMRKRLTTQSVAGQAHIKTGTLNDARAVAGFVHAASGHCIAVVAFINHPEAPNGQAVQDAFIQWVYEHG
jgi:serine-type D-Ala-D-Ala carboxypeptidase/endopeptidase (penicillin-binding protein 4)